ncbi:hypothetical protein GLYMA_02G145400v4 [Glycine max]|uniref:Uncharacterized protein n=2 Tax=Glycine subgen. Soja TaxID=1462606 RepID=K7K8D8_SOYBN|nr:hypothetical protein GYH30_004024 [Glycine max]KHN18865.1 hypothetical protein glysoja_028234 [Glycine soja]KRH71392.1 hypothetical protein GLYMA_02G145400v4 [Glycine max]
MDSYTQVNNRTPEHLGVDYLLNNLCNSIFQVTKVEIYFTIMQVVPPAINNKAVICFMFRYSSINGSSPAP